MKINSFLITLIIWLPIICFSKKIMNDEKGNNGEEISEVNDFIYIKLDETNVENSVIEYYFFKPSMNEEIAEESKEEFEQLFFYQLAQN